MHQLLQRLSLGQWELTAIASQAVFMLVMSALTAASAEAQTAVKAEEWRNNPPATTVKEWLAQQAQSEVVRVTGVRLNPSPVGIEVALETAAGRLAQPIATSEGNTLVAEVSNAILALPDGKEFRVENPATGITQITVTQLGGDRVRVRVTGANAVPTAQVVPGARGLVLSVIPGAEEPEEEITVTGEQNRYRPPTASTGTRLEIPQRDLPLSIQAIPREVMEDRGVFRLEELADNVSGVQAERGYGGLSSQGYRIRGFITNFETLRNGFPDYGYFSPRDVANVERVEFLKGPAAVLYGGSPTQYYGGSGVVNTITKKPLSQPSYNLGFTYGSYNFVRPTIDISAPLTSDKSVRYRLNAAYERADSFRDFIKHESFFISPVLEWQISDRTKLTLEYEHQTYNLKFDQGFPIEPEILKLPRNRFLGEPSFSNGNVNFNSVAYVLEHTFSDTVKFRQGFNYLSSVLRNARQSFYAGLQDDRRTLDRFLSASDEEHGNLTFQNQLSIKFDTGPVKHTLLLGVDYARNLFNYLFAPDLELPIDIFNPQYGGTPTPIEGGEPFGRKVVSNTVGIFVQDFVELLPNLKLLLGGRLDFNQYTLDDRVTNETINEQSVTRFSPRVGLVYQPTQTTSLFFNWGNSFSPQFQARSRTDELFDPQTTQQYEVGIKQDLIKDRLGATLAFYEVKKQNVLTPDPEDSRFSIQTGEQRSRGIELDITGEILPGWNVIATYAYMDAIVTKDNQIPVGDRLFGVPQHSAGLWTTYRFLKGNLRGLGVGLGITYLGEQEVDLPNSFTVPAYAKLDAALFYERDQYRFALNFKNITNAKSYQLDSYNIDPNAPFTVFATVSVKF